MSDQFSTMMMSMIEQLGHAELSAADRLQALKAELDGDGREKALQCISNPTLDTESRTSALRRADKVALDTIKTHEKAATAGVEALLRIHLAKLRRDLAHETLGSHQPGEDGETTSPKRRGKKADEVSPELMAFYHAMKLRGVTDSMLDQLRGFELDLYAEGFKEKVRDYRHEDATGFWVRLVRAGLIDVPVEGLSADEREAVSIALSRTVPEEVIAKRFLEEAAGRPLDISGPFALALFLRHLSGHDEEHGLSITGYKIGTAEDLADTDLILKTLGITWEQSARIWAVRGPDIRDRFTSLAASDEERRAAERERMLPYLRIALDYVRDGDGPPRIPSIPPVRGVGENIKVAAAAALTADMIEAIEERDAWAIASLLRREPEWRAYLRSMGYEVPSDDEPDDGYDVASGGGQQPDPRTPEERAPAAVSVEPPLRRPIELGPSSASNRIQRAFKEDDDA